MVSGEDITISNNHCSNPASGFALTVLGYKQTTMESTSYLFQRGRIGKGVNIQVNNNKWDCKGGITTYPGSNCVLNVMDNIITVVPDKNGEPHRGTALELNDCRELTVERNTFNNSFRNSITRSNVYITLNKCRGKATISGNSFDCTRTLPDNTSYFLFTQETALDQLTIKDNVTNVSGIKARAVEGKISVKGKKVISNNGKIVVNGAAL